MQLNSVWGLRSGFIYFFVFDHFQKTSDVLERSFEFLWSPKHVLRLSFKFVKTVDLPCFPLHLRPSAANSGLPLGYPLGPPMYVVDNTTSATAAGRSNIQRRGKRRGYNAAKHARKSLRTDSPTEYHQLGKMTSGPWNVHFLARGRIGLSDKTSPASYMGVP
jgi:hypothetical protein